jgi:hypothetical protein
LLNECGPLRFVKPLTEDDWIVKPAEQTPDRIWVDKFPEKVSVEGVVKPIQGYVHEAVENQQDYRASVGVIGHVQTQPSFAMRKEGSDRPVLSVRVREPLAPILKLGYRRQLDWARLHRTQLASRHAG